MPLSSSAASGSVGRRGAPAAAGRAGAAAAGRAGPGTRAGRRRSRGRRGPRRCRRRSRRAASSRRCTGPALLASLSRMIAIDQRGSAGGGANMIASSLRFSDVRCSGGGGGGPVASVVGFAEDRRAGRAEDVPLEDLLDLLRVDRARRRGAGARTRAAWRGGPPLTHLAARWRSRPPAPGRSRTARSPASRRPRGICAAVSPRIPGPAKATPGPCPRRDKSV